MRFIRSSGTTVAFRILSLACGFGISILIGRLFGPQGRGIYGLAMTVVVLSVNFGLFGIAGANAYLIGGNPSRARALGIQSLVTGFLGALIAAIIVLTVRYFLPGVLGELQGGVLWATLAIVPFFLWGTLFSYAFLGQGRILAFNLFETAEKLALMGLGTVMLLAFHFELSSFFVTVAVAIGVVTIIYMVRYFSTLPGDGPLLDRSLITPAFSYGMRSYAATITTFAVLRSGVFFVNYFRGAADTGLYSVAQQMAEALVIIPSVIGTVLFSRVARGDSKKLAPRVIRSAAFMLLPVSIALAIGRNMIFTTLFGPDFLPSGQVFLLLLPGTFLLGIEVIMASDIAGRGYPWTAALAWIPILIINIIGYVLLIPHYGISGAAISTTISFIALFIFMTWYYCRLGGYELADLFVVRREDLRTVISALTALVSQKTKIASERTHDSKSHHREIKAEVERTGTQA